MIRAGSVEEIRADSENWIILDIGFSNKAKSCGLKLGDADTVELTFSGMVDAIVEFIQNNTHPTNLLIEAPLSVAFDKKGNPKGRKIEKHEGQTRYWYTGPGCATMVAAMYLVRAIQEECHSNEVRLFEGLVSYKEKGVKSDHKGDVGLLREVVDDPEKYVREIISPHQLKFDTDDKLNSAFEVLGIDTAGIPPVIWRKVQ